MTTFKERVSMAYKLFVSFDYTEYLPPNGYQAMLNDIFLFNRAKPMLDALHGMNVNLDNIMQLVVNDDDPANVLSHLFPNFSGIFLPILSDLPEIGQKAMYSNIASLFSRYYLMNLGYQDTFAVSENLLNKFGNPKMSEKFKVGQILELLERLDYPMLFVFETGITISVHRNRISTNNPEILVLDCSYGENQYRIAMDNSQEEDSLQDCFSEIDQYIADSPLSELNDNCEIDNWNLIAQGHAICVINLMLFMVSKDTEKVYSEFNGQRIKAQERLDKGFRAKQQRKKLAKLPEYKFVDMEISIDRYTKKYRESRPGTSGTPKTPHWRDAHHHPYWVGKGDNKRLELRYIPDIWVGDPALMTPKPLKFKIPRLV
jgi:hypothetical protein